MHIILSANPPGHDWQSTLGTSRDAVITKILAGNWFDDGSSDFILDIGQQKTEPFSLYFKRYDNAKNCARPNIIVSEQSTLGRMKIAEVDNCPEFNIIFNYEGNPGSIRLRNVFLKSARYEKIGQKLLGAVCHAAIGMQATRIFVEPGMDGSAYWTSRGALIQQWPERQAAATLDTRCQKILREKNAFAVNWSDADFNNLQDIFARRDCLGLNKMITRDDLYVEDDISRLRLRRYLVADVPLGTCIFDLTHPWTQKCLRDRKVFNVPAADTNICAMPRRPDFAAIILREGANHSL